MTKRVDFESFVSMEKYEIGTENKLERKRYIRGKLLEWNIGTLLEYIRLFLKLDYGRYVSMEWMSTVTHIHPILEMHHSVLNSILCGGVKCY